MINDASVVIGGGNWGIKEADVLGYKLINDEFYARDIDFANSTAAGTYTDSTGVIRRSPYNLLLQSNTFNTTWTNIGSSETSGQAGYDGTNNAWSLVEDSAGGAHTLVQIPSTFGLVTLSVYAKAGTRNWLFLRGVQGGLNVRAWFNLSTGTIGTVETNGTARIVSVGNGWYRCSLTIADFQSGFEAYIALSNADAISGYTGNGTGNILIQSAQLVQGTEALPYFPTTTRLNVPRIDYRNADGSLSTVGRLLLEPQRTNLALYSEQFDNAYWQKDVGASVTANAATSPDGSANADRLSFISSGVAVYRSGFGLSGAHRFTIYLKGEGANIGKEIYLEIAGGTSINVTLTGSWQRFTAIADNALSVAIKRLNLGQADSVLAWGLQLEAGAYPTTYIPTTTATVTRNVDIASRTGVSSWIGSPAGTIFLQVQILSLGYARSFISLQDASYATNSIRIETTTANRWRIQIRNASTTILDQTILTGSAFTTGNYKIAYAYDTNTNGIAFYVNGVSLFTTTVASIPTACDSLFLGTRLAGIYDLNVSDSFDQAALFKTRLDNATLEQLTTI